MTHGSLTSARPSTVLYRRTGGAAVFLIIALIVIGLLAAGVRYMVAQASVPEEIQIIQFKLVKANFEHVVTEQGEVESSAKIEVRCEVDSPNQGGTEIIWVIEEGADVKGPKQVATLGSETAASLANKYNLLDNKYNLSEEDLRIANPTLEENIKQRKEITIPGHLLVTLNKKALQDARDNQNKAVVSAQSSVTASENKWTQATISLEEYLKGTFLQEKQLVESEILVAREQNGRAKDTAKFSSRLAALGFLTAEQLKADLFAVKQAEVDLALALSRMDTLENISKKKMEVGFQSDIKAAQADVDAKTAILEQEQSKLDEIDLNLTKCDIRAPAEGQVIYHNVYSSRSGRVEFVVEAGSRARERQTIIDLPNPKLMQVKAKINEAGIRYVEDEQEAVINIGALQGQVIRGEVIKVNQIPEPSSVWGSQVKEYGTIIKIIDPPETIRSGMTAEVKILVERKEKVLLLPVQAIQEVAGHFFCLVNIKDKNGTDRLETREIKIGSSNEKMIIFDEAATKKAKLTGIKENDILVENLRAHVGSLIIPRNLKDMHLKSIGKKGTTVEAPKKPLPAAGDKPADNQQPPAGGGGSMIDRFDSDGDGKISAQELPERMRDSFMERRDKNKDGFIDKEEAAATGGGGGRQPGGGRPGGAR